MKIGLFFHEIAFITKFPGSNFLLPTFLTGGKKDFQVANLLLATVNFEPCSYTKIEQNNCKSLLKMLCNHFLKNNQYIDKSRYFPSIYGYSKWHILKNNQYIDKSKYFPSMDGLIYGSRD